MNLIPVAVKHLPAVIPQTIEMASEEDEAHLAHLIRVKQNIEEELTRVEDNISEAYAFYRKDDTFIELEAEMSELIHQHNEIADELNSLASRSQEESDQSDYDEPKPQQEKKEPSKRTRTILEKLYKKISLKTHPDRTTNKELNALFHTATHLYQNGDIEGLEDLLDLITAASGKVASIRNKARAYIKQKIEEYKAIINVVRNQLTFAKHSPGYQLYQIKKGNSPDYAVYIANKGLEANIEKITSVLEEMRNKLAIAKVLNARQAEHKSTSEGS